MDTCEAHSKAESQEAFFLRHAIATVEQECHDSSEKLRNALPFVLAMAICYVESIDGTETMED